MNAPQNRLLWSRKSKPFYTPRLGFFTRRQFSCTVLVFSLYLLSICCFSANITRRLVSPSETTATDTIDAKVMFPSIHDAVISAVRSRDLEVCSFSSSLLIKIFILIFWNSFIFRSLPLICLSLTSIDKIGLVLAELGRRCHKMTCL